MSEEKGKNIFLSFFNDLWSVARGNPKNYFLLLLLILGIILMFASSFFAPKKNSIEGTISAGNPLEKSSPSGSFSYEEELVKSLQHVLENIEGITGVQIFINFTGTKESFYARVNEESIRRTTEQDREGGRREIYESSIKEDYVLLKNSSGEKPLLLRESMPEIHGILIVAGGVENSLLQFKVVRAIQSVLNLPAHKIAVLPLGENKNIKDERR